MHISLLDYFNPESNWTPYIVAVLLFSFVFFSMKKTLSISPFLFTYCHFFIQEKRLIDRVFYHLDTFESLVVIKLMLNNSDNITTGNILHLYHNRFTQWQFAYILKILSLISWLISKYHWMLIFSFLKWIQNRYFGVYELSVIIHYINFHWESYQEFTMKGCVILGQVSRSVKIGIKILKSQDFWEANVSWRV